MKKDKRIILILVLILVYIVLDMICYNTKWIHLHQVALIQNNEKSKNPYFINIDLDNNKLYIFKDGKLIKEYPVAGGKATTPSPIGTWSIISKSNWGEDFGGSWMGFNIPWGKYGIHGTDEPWSIGKDLSHGCIRMYNKDAKEVRKMIPVGTKVTITKGPYGPFGDRFRILKPGDIGADVMAVQKILKELGYFGGYPNGNYNDETKMAVHKFQKANKLQVRDRIYIEEYEKMGVLAFE